MNIKARNILINKIRNSKALLD